MTEQRRSGVYTRRRDLRDSRDPREVPLPPPPPETLAAWVPSAAAKSPRFAGSPPGERPRPFEAGPSGPATQDLEIYRPDAALPTPRTSAGSPALPPWAEDEAPPADRGERTRAAVERWSLWAAGLGKPPRDRAGRRRYPGRESLLPPVLLLAAGLGVAGLVGLLAGLLISAPGGDATAASATRPTVTVTHQVTPPAVTATTTRTRTRTATVTATPTPTAPAPDPNAGAALRPGSQGPAVLQLQQDLAALGLYQGQPSGTYDAETRAGVRAFQGGYGVTGDPPGVAGPATLAAVAHAVGRA